MPRQVQRKRGAAWKPALSILALVAVYLALRLPRLGHAPAFADEVTYMRWAQLIRQAPGDFWLVSLRDAKFPLHYWLLALAWVAGDPIVAGRLVSVLLGAAAILPLWKLCGEIEALDAAPPAKAFKPLAVVLAVTCPLFAMNQRMALAESLLLLETIMLARLSLRSARRIVEGVAWLTVALDAVLLGLLWGATLLTKQVFSYTLWALPPLAIACYAVRRGGAGPGVLRRFAAGYAIATGLGAALFVPLLFVHGPWDLRSLLVYKPVFHEVTVAPNRALLAGRNFVQLLVPLSRNGVGWWPYSQPLVSGELYLYLTPPVVLLSACGLGVLAWFRRWRLAAFLLGWCATQWLPLVLGANVFVARYLLTGALPVLLAAAWLLALSLERSRTNWRKAAAWLMAIIAIGWPLTACLAADFTDDPNLAAMDQYRYQYAATAMSNAVRWLRERAANRPLAVVTASGLGLKNDYAWLYLRGSPGIALYCDPPPGTAGAGGGPRDGGYVLGTEQWAPDRLSLVRFAPGEPVYYLVDMVWDDGSHSWRYQPAPPDSYGPQSRVAAIFFNDTSPEAGHPISGIVLVELHPVP